MSFTLFSGFLLLASLALASPALAGTDGRLAARPQSDVVPALRPGVSSLTGDAWVYRPDLPADARPGVIVLFHGAGGNARRFIDLFRAEADRQQMLLLSIQSAGITWDIVRRGAAETRANGRPAPVHATGKDARNVDTALSILFKRTPVDPGRIVAAGFSDGASYALTIGRDNHHLFKGIVALAPGFVGGTGFDRNQRIAVAHGQSDRILSYANAERMTETLDDLGYPVRFIPFDGDHGVDRQSLATALDFVLAG